MPIVTKWKDMSRSQKDNRNENRRGKRTDETRSRKRGVRTGEFNKYRKRQQGNKPNLGGEPDKQDEDMNDNWRPDSWESAIRRPLLPPVAPEDLDICALVPDERASPAAEEPTGTQAPRTVAFKLANPTLDGLNSRDSESES